MYSNYSLLCGLATIVLDANLMLSDQKDINKFVENEDNAVCHYDSTKQKIYINLNETGEKSRTNGWIKEFGKYFVYELSKKGIESFHNIKIDPIIKPIFVNSIIKTSNPIKKKFEDLKRVDSKLFVKTNYDSFINFAFNINNDVSINAVNDYTDNCYSYSLFKSILDIYKLDKTHNLYFFEFDDQGKKSNAFIVDFGDNVYEIFDFSNKPPRGNGGPFFNLLQQYLIEILKTQNK